VSLPVEVDILLVNCDISSSLEDQVISCVVWSYLVEGALSDSRAKKEFTTLSNLSRFTFLTVTYFVTLYLNIFRQA